MIIWFGLWCLTSLSTIYFSYIVVVSFIDGGNQSTRRKRPICRKSLTNCHIILYRVHLVMYRIMIISQHRWHKKSTLSCNWTFKCFLGCVYSLPLIWNRMTLTGHFEKKSNVHFIKFYMKMNFLLKLGQNKKIVCFLHLTERKCCD